MGAVTNNLINKQMALPYEISTVQRRTYPLM